MAYLPPAGIGLPTDHKRYDLITGKEIGNRIDFGKKPIRRINKNQYSVCDLPPTSIKAEDWELPSRTRYDGIKACQENKWCALGNECWPCLGNDTGTQHGMYHETYDVRKKADWFNRWQNENCKYAGAFHIWTKMYGNKYFYNERGDNRRCNKGRRQ